MAIKLKAGHEYSVLADCIRDAVFGDRYSGGDGEVLTPAQATRLFEHIMININDEFDFEDGPES